MVFEVLQGTCQIGHPAIGLRIGARMKILLQEFFEGEVGMISPDLPVYLSAICMNLHED